MYWQINSKKRSASIRKGEASLKNKRNGTMSDRGGRGFFSSDMSNFNLGNFKTIRNKKNVYLRISTFILTILN